jgi:hypothetical protein
MSWISARLASGLALGWTVLLSGCGGSAYRTVPVEGTVTYQGKPVTSGTITFVPEKPGPAASGTIRPDGIYVLSTDGAPGAVPGRYTVMIISLGNTAGVLPEQRNPLPPLHLPEKYSNNRRSGLTAEVLHQDNVINFALP